MPRSGAILLYSAAVSTGMPAQTAYDTSAATGRAHCSVPAPAAPASAGRSARRAPVFVIPVPAPSPLRRRKPGPRTTCGFVTLTFPRHRAAGIRQPAPAAALSPPKPGLSALAASPCGFPGSVSRSPGPSRWRWMGDRPVRNRDLTRTSLPSALSTDARALAITSSRANPTGWPLTCSTTSPASTQWFPCP